MFRYRLERHLLPVETQFDMACWPLSVFGDRRQSGRAARSPDRNTDSIEHHDAIGVLFDRP